VAAGTGRQHAAAAGGFASDRRITWPAWIPASSSWHSSASGWSTWYPPG
jgi:hypothetical protein